MMSYSHDFGGIGLIWMALFGALIAVPFWRLLPQCRFPAWVSSLVAFRLDGSIPIWVSAARHRAAGGLA